MSNSKALQKKRKKQQSKKRLANEATQVKKLRNQGAKGARPEAAKTPA
jgi:hypothetical protein